MLIQRLAGQRGSQDEPVNHATRRYGLKRAHCHIPNPAFSRHATTDATFTDGESFSPRINVAVSSMTPADIDRYRSLSAFAI